MTIKVYSSIMPGEPVEVYDDHGMTVEAWVSARADNYQRGSVQPISCMVNGAIVKPMDWADTVIGESDVVEFRPVPLGGTVGDIISVALPFWGGSVAAGQAAIDAIMPNIPSASDSMGQQGSQLSPADARANTARLGQGIPELFGRYIRYPDYVNQPRRYYKDARTQCLDLMLSVGVGSYSIESDSIRIGETPFSRLSSAVNYAIFEPGASVAGNQCHQNWYTAPEVGGTTNSAGIRLYRGERLSSGAYAGLYGFNGNEIEYSSSGGLIPDDWAVGDFIVVQFENEITVSTDGNGDNVLTIGLPDWGTFAVGDTLRLRGVDYPAMSGEYVIESMSGPDITISQGGVMVQGWANGTYTTMTAAPWVEFRIDAKTYSTLSPGVVLAITVSRFEYGVQVPGEPSWGNFAQVADLLLSERSANEGWAGPSAACPSGETTTTIECHCFWPQ